VLQVLETPGHTPDSICLLLTDRDAPDQPPKLLSGDTLFLGDVGRPDLAGGVGFDPAAMAAMLYESLRTKIAKLPGAAEVFPGHGAGSACGRNISDAPSSTLEQQRLANPALQPMSQEAFVRELTAGLCPPPPYFARAAELNRRGPRLLADLPVPADLGLDAVAAQGAQVVDTRSADAFGAAHVPGSINIGLSGSFESWCGALLDLDRPVVLVCGEAAQVGEAQLRLARVAIEAVAGAALGTRAAFARFAVPAPLAELPCGGTALKGLAPGRPTAIVCGSGYRSSAAAHWLRRSASSSCTT
jgi:rhodanese-related sulfurtransferase